MDLYDSPGDRRIFLNVILAETLQRCILLIEVAHVVIRTVESRQPGSASLFLV